MSVRFADFRAQVEELVREKFETNLEEIADVDSRQMREYWQEGRSPKQFFREQVLGSGTPDSISGRGAVEGDDSDFDPRFEL